jgi:SEC-C motif-containing protein
MIDCPCRALDESPILLSTCCGPFLDGKLKPRTAVELMRSRYSAYVLNKISYVDKTQINIQGDKFDLEEASKWAQESEWHGLEVKSFSQGSETDEKGEVEFVAHYTDKKSGTRLSHHETSTFLKKDGNWYFHQGKIHGATSVVRSTPKVGRNDPCYCGSGKKYKKCCGL